MTAYITRRALLALPILFMVITLVFFALQLIPGDAARMYVGEQASLEAVERARVELGLDRPVLVQYTSYLTRLVQGDMGKSFITGRPVSVEIKGRFGNTVKLAVVALAFGTALGLIMGTLSAIYQEGFWDYLFSLLSIIGISTPIFWLALLMMHLFSIRLRLLPTVGNETWQHWIMPVLALSVGSIAFVTRMTRSAVLEMLGEDFVRTARAKGLSERVVLVRHALKNALIPITTIVGLRFGYMLGGSVITETIFAWPGLGRLMFTAVGQRDLPLVQGVLLVYASTFVLVNVVVDIIYGFIDPRIRYD